MVAGWRPGDGERAAVPAVHPPELPRVGVQGGAAVSHRHGGHVFPPQPED